MDTEEGERRGLRSFKVDQGPLDMKGVDFARCGKVSVTLAIEALGSANSHIDITLSLLDVAWAIETLAAEAEKVTISVGGYFNREVKATFRRPRATFATALSRVALIFSEGEIDEPSAEILAQIQDIRGQIGDFEDSITNIHPKCPEVIDWYLANLVLGANSEWRSESPDYVQEQFTKFPERRFRYFSSAYSQQLGDTCFCSDTGWILSPDVSLDAFFKATAQKYRLAEFGEAELQLAGGEAIAVGANVATIFPAADFLHGSACIDALMADQLDEEVPEAPVQRGATNLLRGGCTILLHSSGTLLVVDDGGAQHILYASEPIPQVTLASRVAPGALAQARLAKLAGFGRSIDCPWGQLGDDQFEELCYDIVRRHPQIEAATVRKLGKSRSRDGGRDIEAFERLRSPDASPTKWIFQCKLVTNGSSLSGRKLQDVGDMLDQYGAGGFGVMTSAPIDATLYDKLDALCSRRGVKQRNYSVYELERELLQQSDLRHRYFKVTA